MDTTYLEYELIELQLPQVGKTYRFPDCSEAELATRINELAEIMAHDITRWKSTHGTCNPGRHTWGK